MKNFYFILLGLLISLNVYSHEYTVNLTSPGTLSTVIKDDVYYTAITDLKITGEMDARDFRFIKDNLDVLWYLNISEVNIMEVTTVIGTNPTVVNMTYIADEIPLHSFENSALKTIRIPNTCTSIGEKAFNLCSELYDIDFGTSQIETFKKFTISNCHKFVSFLIPETVTKIEYQAFAGCSFTDITFNQNLSLIEDQAFYMCDNITSVYIDNIINVNGEPFSVDIKQNITVYANSNYNLIINDLYWTSFFDVVNTNEGDTPTSIDKTYSNSELVAVYNIYGVEVSKNKNSLKSGIYIFKYNDNSTQKIYVRN